LIEIITNISKIGIRTPIHFKKLFSWSLFGFLLDLPAETTARTKLKVVKMAGRKIEKSGLNGKMEKRLHRNNIKNEVKTIEKLIFSTLSSVILVGF
jgi:hypothetical protein